MDTEAPDSPALAWRVAGHSALSDAGRLRVIDVLGVGDASPSDLATHLGMSSNLLAHHLKVLETAGLVRRLPSESDGRRSYVRLNPDALARLAWFPILALPRERIVFVCSGNSARSQLAAAVWADRIGSRVASAGTHPAARIHPRAAQVARSHGLRLLAEHPASALDVLRPDDTVVTVCDSADREVGVAHIHWSIPDPVPVGTDRAFETTLAEITQRIADWVGAQHQ